MMRNGRIPSVQCPSRGRRVLAGVCQLRESCVGVLSKISREQTDAMRVTAQQRSDHARSATKKSEAW